MNVHFGCGSYTTSRQLDHGAEFSCPSRFQGTFDELTLVTNPKQFWHGSTVGADAVAPLVVGTPEPASLALCGTGAF